MKTPFRLQVSECDCVPTSFINALGYLFERKEIPPVVLQRVYLYCLDSFSHSRAMGHGTTSHGSRILANWLMQYKERRFSVLTEVVERTSVSLAQNNALARCLNSGGVAVMTVKHYGRWWHSILAISVRDRWIYAFDPYPRSPKSNREGCYEFLEPKSPHDPNLRIHYDWADTLSDKLPFRFGTLEHREWILINRQPLPSGAY